MRKRKRDWPLRVLCYRAYPIHIPQSVWDTARIQRELWNKLVTLANQTSEWTRLLGDKRQGWRGFDAAAKELVAQSRLDWVNGPEVLDRLRTAIKSKRWPRFHASTDRIALFHRYTSGGIAIGKLIDNRRAKRFAFESSGEWQLPRLAHSPDKKHWRAHFAVSKEQIEFSLVLHRSLPDEGILKRVGWLGQVSAGKWFWRLALTIEEPPKAMPCHSSQLTAGLDLGWRLFRDGGTNDYIRIGMLADSEGRTIELRLPLRLRQGPKSEQRDISYLAELQSLAAEFLKSAQTLAGDKQLGHSELRKLAAADHEHAAGIRAALAARDMLRRRMSEQRFHMIRRRRWWYQNLALWLCRRYSQIAVEADMTLSQLHTWSSIPGFRPAEIYRKYAAVGELRRCIRAEAMKTGTRVDGYAAKTTITCWLCGAEATRSAKLMLTCVNGHTLDQDKNAAMNLLSQVNGNFGQTHVLRNQESWGRWKRLEIPGPIVGLAIEVPAG
jgi:hypothetical protein